MAAALRVLMTWPGWMPYFSARRQPLPSQSSWPGACASVSMANWQPASTASRSSRPGGVLALGPAVDLDRDAVVPAGREDRFGIELRFEPAAAGEQPAGAVPEHVRVRAGHRGDHPLGHRPGGHPQLRVHAGDHHGERR